MISIELKCHAECRVAEDNWAGLSSAAKRRKLQNRLNQRAFRRRKAAQWKTEQMSRDGSADSASASTTLGHRSSRPDRDIPSQGPMSLKNEAKLDSLDPIWDQPLSTNVQSNPWISSDPGIWYDMTREAQQYAIKASVFDCGEEIPRNEDVVPHGNLDCGQQETILNQPPNWEVAHEDMTSNTWLDGICDDGWFELWSKTPSIDQWSEML